MKSAPAARERPGAGTEERPSMQEHRTAEPAAPAASAPPTIRTVQGLGVVDALRVDFRREQVPWLIAELDELGVSLERNLSDARALYDELPEAAKQRPSARARALEQEVERRAYQLQVLVMVRDQLPIGLDDAEDAGRSACETPTSAGADLAGHPSYSLVGPAVVVTALLGRSAHRAVSQLHDTLRGRGDVSQHEARPFETAHLMARPPRAEELRALAAAAQAFTNTLVDAVALQAYTFDPDYTPIRSDELE
jgi:hypothetical protein